MKRWSPRLCEGGRRELREELRVEGLREREGQLGPGRAAEPRRKKRWLSVKIGRFGRIWVSGGSNLEGSSDFSSSGGVYRVENSRAGGGMVGGTRRGKRWGGRGGRNRGHRASA